MSAGYEKDVILWSQEQAALLRSGQLTQLDTSNFEMGSQPEILT